MLIKTMKTKFVLVLLLVLVLVRDPARAQNLFVNVHNLSSQTAVNRRVTLTLLEAGPVTAGPWLIAGDSVSQSTDTNGFTTFSNVLAGGYRLDIAGNPSRSFPLGMPSTNNTQNASALIGATNTLPLYYSVDQLAALGVPPFANAFYLTNFQNGVVLSGAFIGDGSQLTNGPYASSNYVNQFAANATNQANLKIASNAGSGTNNNLQTPTVSFPATADTIAFTNYQGIGSPGDVWDLAILIGAYGGGLATNQAIQFNGPGGSYWSIAYQGNHNGLTDPELVLSGVGSIAIKPNFTGSIISNAYVNTRGLQFAGAHTDFRAPFTLGADHATPGGANQPGNNKNLGWSVPIRFQASYFNASSQDIFPGFQLWMLDTNGGGAIELFDNITDAIPFPYTNWANAFTTPTVQFRVGGTTNTGRGFDVPNGTVNLTNLGATGIGTTIYETASNHIWQFGASGLNAVAIQNFGTFVQLIVGSSSGGVNAGQKFYDTAGNTFGTIDSGDGIGLIAGQGVRFDCGMRVGDGQFVLYNGNGLEVAGNALVTGSLTMGTVGGAANGSYSAITNNGIVWYALSTNVAGKPLFIGPPGSICTETNGSRWTATNSAGTLTWVQF